MTPATVVDTIEMMVQQMAEGGFQRASTVPADPKTPHDADSTSPLRLEGILFVHFLSEFGREYATCLAFVEF